MSENEQTNQQQGDPAELGDAGKKALQAERDRAAAAEKRVKELEAAVKEREDAELSEVDRLTKQLQERDARIGELESTATQSGLDLIRYQVATEKGIPSAWVARLQGTDRESFEADADALLPSLRTDNPNPTPKADPSQGAGDGGGSVSNAQAFANALGDF